MAKPEYQAAPSAPAASSVAAPSTASASPNGSGRSAGKKRRLAETPPPAQAARSSSKGPATRATRSRLDRAASTDERSRTPAAKDASNRSRSGGNGSKASSGKENSGDDGRPTHRVDKRRFARRTRPPTPTEKPPVSQEKKSSPVKSEASSSSGVSETTTFLFQMNCRMLQTAMLEHDVQLSELKEKSALIHGERTRWEKKIAKMQRKLRKLDDKSGPENDSSSVEHHPSTKPSSSGDSDDMLTVCDSISGQPSTPSLTETVTPSSVELIENEMQETMRMRSQRMNDIIKTLHEVNGLPDQDTRLG